MWVEQRATREQRKPWRIEHRDSGEGDFHLVNTTATPKYHVTVSGEPVQWGGSGDDELQIRRD